MSAPSRDEVVQFVECEELEAMADFEVLESERGDVPDRRRLPLAFAAFPLRIAFALLLGSTAGALTLLVNFVIFNMVLHLS